MKKNVLKILKERGLVDASSNDQLEEYLATPRKVYLGFDPTADSLHLGNLVGLIVLRWFLQCGHNVVAMVGGATGMIGDPSGKSQERNLLDEESLQKNLKGIAQDARKVLGSEDSSKERCTFLNNYDWFKDFSFLDFLRDVGKSFRVGPMLAKESVKARISSEEGISFTEFSYQILQGYDFLHLFDHEGVTLQIGGSDQWGNMTAGIELVRKKRAKEVFALTFPLLVNNEGKKFGKSEKGAIWLSEEKLSAYEFYQALFSVSDADVLRFLRMLTTLPLEKISALEEEMNQGSYAPNTAQKLFAEELTRLVHGEAGLQKALQVTEALKPGSLQTELSLDSLRELAKDFPSLSIPKSDLLDKKLLDLFVETKLFNSKGEARRMLKNGGLYLNNQKVTEEQYSLQEADFIESQMLLLGAGKKKKLLVQLSS